MREITLTRVSEENGDLDIVFNEDFDWNDEFQVFAFLEDAKRYIQFQIDAYSERTHQS